jgi:hypothetical protein
MKLTFSKFQWEEAGKKAGWIKTAQGRMNRGEEEMYPTTGKPSINIGAPGSPERVKQEYPNLIKKLQEAKAYGHPIEIAEELMADAGINIMSLEAKSLLEVSGWYSQGNKGNEVEQIKEEIAKTIDNFNDNKLSRDSFDLRMEELIEQVHKAIGSKIDPNAP